MKAIFLSPLLLLLLLLLLLAAFQCGEQPARGIHAPHDERVARARLERRRASAVAVAARLFVLVVVAAAAADGRQLALQLAAPAAVAAVIPGTISKGIPSLNKCSISSPRRPKIHGSPPFNLTTK